MESLPGELVWKILCAADGLDSDAAATVATAAAGADTSSGCMGLPRAWGLTRGRLGLLTASRHLNGLCRWADSVVLRIPGIQASPEAVARGILDRGQAFLDFGKLASLTVVPERPDCGMSVRCASAFFALSPPMPNLRSVRIQNQNTHHPSSRPSPLDSPFDQTFFKSLPDLFGLSLVDCELTVDALAGLRDLGGLRQLSVVSTTIETFDPFACLSAVTSLHVLYLRLGRGVRTEAFEGPWMRGLGHLTALAVVFSTGMHPISVPTNFLCLRSLVTLDLRSASIQRRCFLAIVSGLRGTLQHAAFYEIVGGSGRDGQDGRDGRGGQDMPCSLTSLWLHCLEDVELFFHPLLAGVTRLVVTGCVDCTEETEGGVEGVEGDGGVEVDGGVEGDDGGGESDTDSSANPWDEASLAPLAPSGPSDPSGPFDGRASPSDFAALLRKTALLSSILDTERDDPFFILDAWPRSVPDALAALGAHLGRFVKCLMVDGVTVDAQFVEELTETLPGIRNLSCLKCHVTQEGIDALANLF